MIQPTTNIVTKIVVAMQTAIPKSRSAVFSVVSGGAVESGVSDLTPASTGGS